MSGIYLEPITKGSYEEFFRTCQFLRPDGAGWLNADAEIQEASVTVEPAEGGEAIPDMVDLVAPYDKTQVRYRLKGGEPGTDYLVRIRITDSNNQKFEARALMSVV